MRGKVLFFSVLWLLAAGVVFTVPGCYGENCVGSAEVFGVDAGQGRMVSETQWESNAPDEAWLPFPRQRGYIFDIRALGGRTPGKPTPYLSANQFQTEPGANFVIGAGNIATMQNARPNGIDVRNDTCSDFYLRLVIDVPPLPPTATTNEVEAGVPADAGADADADAGP